MRTLFLAGHKGMVGKAILNHFKKKFSDLKIHTQNRFELDLINQHDVLSYFDKTRPDSVIIAAAKVGGIKSNYTYPAEFIYNNTMIQNNLIHASFKFKVKRLIFLGSSCIYPKKTNIPIQEQALLSGNLEQTNESYAIAKISGLKMCEAYNKQYGTDFRALMPTNLYGPNDNYDYENSHVIPALIRKFYEAKIENKTSLKVWGDGSAKREFLHVNDLAACCSLVFNLSKNRYFSLIDKNSCHINVGTGKDISIKELVLLLKEISNYSGKVIFDTSKPNGTHRKMLDVERILSIGWKPSYSFKEGLNETYKLYETLRLN